RDEFLPHRSGGAEYSDRYLRAHDSSRSAAAATRAVPRSQGTDSKRRPFSHMDSEATRSARTFRSEFDRAQSFFDLSSPNLGPERGPVIAIRSSVPAPSFAKIGSTGLSAQRFHPLIVCDTLASRRSLPWKSSFSSSKT